MNRRRYIDWMRGLVTLAMIEHHTFDAFLAQPLRDSSWARAFRFVGGVAAPGFLFLAGLSMALALEKRPDWRKGAVRGLTIVAAAYVFRVQEWALAWPWSPASDLLRVDILNTIGVALVVVAIIWPLRSIVAFIAAGAAVIAVTPWLWDVGLGHSLPARYLAGQPPADLFPMFPWVAHALLGAAVGLALARGVSMSRLALIAAAAFVGAYALDHGAHDWRWWNVAPGYFAMRTASNVLLLALCFIAEKLPMRLDPLLKLGQHSLAVYWVHVELVYGRWFWKARGALPLPRAAMAFALIVATMTAMAYLIEWRPRPLLEPAA